DATDLALLAAFYLTTAVGVTVGFHRLLTHRSFQTHPSVERAFAILGSLSVQGSVLDWVADHRKHHAHTDEEGDPHSPHVGHGSGLRGLWHAHTGWLFETHGQADWKKYARDLFEDRGMRRIGTAFPWLALYSLVLPAPPGLVLRGWERALDPSAWVIALMERLGLVWNVVRISPERQAARTVPALGSGRRGPAAG